MNIPAELKYTQDHEWIRIDGNVATVGITDFAQSELGDIVYVEVDTVGQVIEKGKIFGTIEAVKTVSDLFIPVTAKVIEFNKTLETAPETVNSDPYGMGWVIKISIENQSELNDLLSSESYSKLTGV